MESNKDQIEEKKRQNTFADMYWGLIVELASAETPEELTTIQEACQAIVIKMTTEESKIITLD